MKFNLCVRHLSNIWLYTQRLTATIKSVIFVYNILTINYNNPTTVNLFVHYFCTISAGSFHYACSCRHVSRLVLQIKHQNEKCCPTKVYRHIYVSNYKNANVPRYIQLPGLKLGIFSYNEYHSNGINSGMLTTLKSAYPNLGLPGIEPGTFSSNTRSAHH